MEYKNDKYQLHCPRCNHEFTYDNGYYDKQIAKLGKEISEIHLQLANYNRLSTYGKRAKAEWKKRTVIALNEKTKELIYYAGMLQNIGKITLPEELFTKKQKLSQSGGNNQ